MANVDVRGLPHHHAVGLAATDAAALDDDVAGPEDRNTVVIAVDVATGDVDVTIDDPDVGHPVEAHAGGAVIAFGLVTHGNIFEHEMLGLVVAPGPDAPDHRDERPGVMFSEMDLIGIPHRLVIGERGLKSGTVEYRNRRDQAAQDYPLETLVETLKTLSNI